MPDTKAETLFSVIKDILIQCNLPLLALCRGQAYDGAANMQGKRLGVGARFRHEYPLQWCQLVGPILQDVIKKGTPALKKVTSVQTICEAMNTCNVFKDILPAVHKNCYDYTWQSLQLLKHQKEPFLPLDIF